MFEQRGRNSSAIESNYQEGLGALTGQIVQLCAESQERKGATPAVTLFQHVLIDPMHHPLLSEVRVAQAQDSDRDSSAG